jgi:sulfonate transport system substrate-binding protein
MKHDSWRHNGRHVVAHGGGCYPARKNQQKSKEERSMRRPTFALSCAAALALVVAGAAHGAEPVKIRASWVVAPSDWTPLLLEKPDLMRHQGKSYAFEPMRFQGTPAVITALANNELELGNLAFSSLALAIQNAGLEDLRIVGDQFKDGAEGHYTNQFFVLKDSPVQKVADLKGKIVATNAAGSAVDIAMRAMLRKHGLEDKRDYTMIEAPFPTMKAMLVQKKADLAPFVAPFSFDPELKQIARPLFAQKDAIGTTQMIVWVARKGFLEKNRAAMVDFMEDSLRCAGISIPRTTAKWRRSPRASPSSRPSAFPAGCSPTRTMPAAPTCCRTLRRCRPISRCSATSDS